MKIWTTIKDNLGPIMVVGGVLLSGVWIIVQVSVSSIALDTVKGDSARVYINELIAEKLATVDLDTDDKIVAMDKVSAANTFGVKANKETVGNVEQRLQKVAEILYSPPEP
jgi:hypothetical protein